MTEPFLSVYGHITIDQIVSVGKFPDINETVDIMSKKTTLGGTGTNIAIEAARLGVPTALCGLPRHLYGGDGGIRPHHRRSGHRG